MTVGPATLLAIAAAVLATFLWWLVKRPQPSGEILAMFLFGVALAVVVLAGPLVHMP